MALDYINQPTIDVLFRSHRIEIAHRTTGHNDLSSEYNFAFRPIRVKGRTRYGIIHGRLGA